MLAMGITVPEVLEDWELPSSAVAPAQACIRCACSFTDLYSQGARFVFGDKRLPLVLHLRVVDSFWIDDALRCKLARPDWDPSSSVDRHDLWNEAELV